MNEEKKRVLSVISGILGKVACLVLVFSAIIKLIPYASGTISKKLAKHSNAKNEDDWGPVIERKKATNAEDITNAN